MNYFMRTYLFARNFRTKNALKREALFCSFYSGMLVYYDDQQSFWRICESCQMLGDEEKNADNDPMIQQLLRNETTVK